MKKTVVFLLFFIFSQLFADENTSKYEDVSFPWQLSYQNKTDQEINFLNLNPSLFNTDIDFFPTAFYKNDARNSSSQNRQNVNLNFQRNDIFGFISSLVFFTAASFVPLNRQEKEIYNNTWEQQKNEEQMRQRFIENNYRR